MSEIKNVGYTSMASNQLTPLQMLLFILFLSQLDELFTEVGQNVVSLCVWSCVCPNVCLGVNESGTNRNRCTQRFLVVHEQTY